VPYASVRAAAARRLPMTFLLRGWMDVNGPAAHHQLTISREGCQQRAQFDKEPRTPRVHVKMQAGGALL